MWGGAWVVFQELLLGYGGAEFANIAAAVLDFFFVWLLQETQALQLFLCKAIMYPEVSNNLD